MVKRRLRRLEKMLELESKAPRPNHLKEQAEQIKRYLESDEPIKPITETELDEFSPYLRSLYKKYMTEHIIKEND